MPLYSAKQYDRAHWGDSLTAGTGASDPTTRYPYVVNNSGPRGRWFYPGGVGSETSTQIKTRLLAATASILACTTVIWVGRNNFNDPTTVKADAAAMVAALGHSRYLVLSVINGNAVSERIGGSDYNLIVGINTDFAATYGARYVDVRSPLVAAGAPGGSNPDATSYGYDQPASGLVNGSPHLNDAGYAIVAAQVYAALATNNW